MQAHASRADFKMVYIAEAHACDEWPIGSPFARPQSTTVDERRQSALEMQQLGLRMPLFVAPIDSEFERQYKPWPFRYFVVHSGHIALLPSPHHERYDLIPLWDFLASERG